MNTSIPGIGEDRALGHTLPGERSSARGGEAEEQFEEGQPGLPRQVQPEAGAAEAEAAEEDAGLWLGAGDQGGGLSVAEA